MKSVRCFLLILVCFSLAWGFLIKQEKNAYAQRGIIGKMREVLPKVEGKKKGDVPKACQDDPHSDACKKAEEALAEEKKRAQQELEKKTAEYKKALENVKRLQEEQKKCRDDACRERLEKEIQQAIGDASKLASDASQIRTAIEKLDASHDAIMAERLKGGSPAPKTTDGTEPKPSDKDAEAKPVEKDAEVARAEEKKRTQQELEKKNTEYKKALENVKRLQEEQKKCRDDACRERLEKEIQQAIGDASKLAAKRRKGGSPAPKTADGAEPKPSDKKAEDALAEEKKRAQQELEKKTAEETAEKSAEPEERVETVEGPNGAKITRTYGKGGVIREVEERRDGSTVVRERDKNGNPVEIVTSVTAEGHKRETVRTVTKPDGSRVVETANHLYNTTSQTVYDQNGRKVTSETFDKENNRISHFERQPDGTANETIRKPGGGATQITYDKEDLFLSSRTLDKDKRVLETYQKYKDGSASYKVFNHKTGVTTEGEIWENGSQVIKQVDKDGTVLNEVGLTKKGSHFSYTIGGDAENAWKAGGTFSKGRAESKQSFIADTHSESSRYENPRQAEIDQKLIAQMNGGKAVAGEDLIVRNTWKENVGSESHEAMNKRLRESNYEHISSDTEIRAIEANGPYDVRHVGRNPVKGSGYGESPSEALSNALNEAAHVVRTDIQSEFVTHTKSHEASKGGKTTAWTMDERVAKQSEHRANVILKDYKVTAVKKTEFGYEVIIDATPGVTVRK